MVNLALPPERRANGASVAALLSAAFGLLVLGVIVLWTELSVPMKNFVFDVGKAWIPRASEIGPYSGKETFLLVGWLASWVGLHFALRDRHVNVRIAFGVAMLMVAAALLLIWPPFWHLFE